MHKVRKKFKCRPFHFFYIWGNRSSVQQLAPMFCLAELVLTLRSPTLSPVLGTAVISRATQGRKLELSLYCFPYPIQTKNVASVAECPQSTKGQFISPIPRWRTLSRVPCCTAAEPAVTVLCCHLLVQWLPAFQKY